MAVFAGTETRLYLLDNTTLNWVDVSKSGNAYAGLSSGAHWSFAQFNDVIIAVQANTPPQAFTLSSSTEFADLEGSPPQAAHVAVVNRFVVLSGLASFPKRVQWSGLNAITTWTATVNYSDFQDLPDGGNARCVVGGEFGVILQDTAIRRMIFSPGSDIVFQIDRIAKDIGVTNPHSVVDASGTIFFLSAKGFMKLNPEGGLTPIGKERVDRTFLKAYDPARPDLVIGAANPEAHTILWSYKTKDVAMDAFNKVLAFDFILDRWTPIDLEGEYLTSLAKPGITLEALNMIGAVPVANTADNGSGAIRLTVTSTAGWANNDIKEVADVGGTVEANGSWPITVISSTEIDLQGSCYLDAYTDGGYVAGSLDNLPISLDDFETATLARLAAFSSDHVLGFFSGDNLEATLQTGEQSGVARRLFVRGVYPITDATDAFASIGGRENLKADPSYSGESGIDARGMCPQRVSTRHARVKLRIPAGAEWTFASGVEPDYTGGGKR